MRSTKWTLIIRMVAAVYIIYLAVSLINEIRKGAATGGMLVLGVIGIVAFFAFAVWAFVSSIKQLIAESKAAPAEGGEDEEIIDEEEEEKARIRAIVEKDRERKAQSEQGQERSGSLFARMEQFTGETFEQEDPSEEIDD